MKNIILTIATLLLLTACGDSSKKKATTTTPTPSGTVSFPTPGADGSVPTATGRSCTGNICIGPPVVSTDGRTPLSFGKNLYPVSTIELRYDYDSAGSAIAQGRMEIDSDYGQGDCMLPKGLYHLSTSKPGVVKTMIHHYGGIILTGAGANNVQMEITNAIATENIKGEWVQDIRLNVTSINGKSCTNKILTFGMPLN